MKDYDEIEFEHWLDNISMELFAMLGESIEDYPEVDFLEYYLSGMTEEDIVREIYEDYA